MVQRQPADEAPADEECRERRRGPFPWEASAPAGRKEPGLDAARMIPGPMESVWAAWRRDDRARSPLRAAWLHAETVSPA
jgi:hypothetical protein